MKSQKHIKLKDSIFDMKPHYSTNLACELSNNGLYIRNNNEITSAVSKRLHSIHKSLNQEIKTLSLVFIFCSHFMKVLYLSTIISTSSFAFNMFKNLSHQDLLTCSLSLSSQ